MEHRASRHTSRLLIVLSALLIGAAVLISSLVQRHDADVARSHEQQAQLLLTAMLDQETGLRGFIISGEPGFLQPYYKGRREYGAALAALRGHVGDAARADLAATDRVARSWQAAAAAEIPQVRSRGPDRANDLSGAEYRKSIFDRFRGAQARLVSQLESDRHSDSALAAWITAAVSLLLALIVGVVGNRVVRAREREERRQREADLAYRDSQSEFSDALQLAEDEHEAQELIRRHLVRHLPGVDIVVLRRNNSANRLEPATRVDDADVAERLQEAEPRACLAVRLGRPHNTGVGETPLMTCAICGRNDRSTACKPLLVGSEVIGSVLASSDHDLADVERLRLRESVAQAAPTLANLRNLALAEARAATDALTGLPNRRAIEDNLKRMVAQASRGVQPLSALMIDLDHFKTINDLYGHEGGDKALAAVGALLTSMLRESDFAGRQGGEEFVVLAPNTDGPGAAHLAEAIRAAMTGLDVPELDHRLTASVGVATLPDVATDGTGLIRMADRALYAAKERGRNRVEVAGAPASQRRGETDSTAAST